MALLGGAVLAIWNDIAPGGDAEYDHWHISEHIPERVGVPGFLRGRRYVAVAAAPKYFMMYETETLATLASPAYVERLNNPTPWTRKCLALFRNSNRTACRTTLSIGRGIGGALATIRLGAATGRESTLRRWLYRSFTDVEGTPLPVPTNVERMRHARPGVFQGRPAVFYPAPRGV